VERDHRRRRRDASHLGSLATSVVVSLFCGTMISAQAARSEDKATASPSVVLTVLRSHESAECTSGQLLVNGKVIAYTLERPWLGNLPLISSIPPGKYAAFIHLKPEGDRWRIQLKDVPLSSTERRDIQIHVGNHLADSVGCILVGSGLAPNLCALTGSIAAHNRLKLAIAEAVAKLGKDETKEDVAIDVIVRSSNPLPVQSPHAGPAHSRVPRPGSDSAPIASSLPEPPNEQNARHLALSALLASDAHGATTAVLSASLAYLQQSQGALSAEDRAAYARLGKEARSVRSLRDYIALSDDPDAIRLGVTARLSGWDPLFQEPVQDVDDWVTPSAQPSDIARLAVALANPAQSQRSAVHDLSLGILGVASDSPLSQLAAEPAISRIEGVREAIFQLAQGSHPEEIIRNSSAPLIDQAVNDVNSLINAGRNLKRAPATVDEFFRTLPTTLLAYPSDHTDSLRARAIALASLAGTLGNEQLQQDVNRIANTVEAVSRVHSAALVVFAGPGGMSLTGISGLLGGLTQLGGSGSSTDSQSVLKAIAALQAYLKRQFEIVNAKLDYLIRGIDELRQGLAQLAQIVAGIRDEVGTIKQELRALSDSIDASIYDQAKRSIAVDLERCRTLYHNDAVASKQIFSECIAVFQSLLQQASIPPFVIQASGQAADQSFQRTLIAIRRSDTDSYARYVRPLARLASQRIAGADSENSRAVPNLALLATAAHYLRAYIERYPTFFTPDGHLIAELNALASAASDAEVYLASFSGADRADRRKRAIALFDNGYARALEEMAVFLDAERETAIEAFIDGLFEGTNRNAEDEIKGLGIGDYVMRCSNQGDIPRNLPVENLFAAAYDAEYRKAIPPVLKFKHFVFEQAPTFSYFQIRVCFVDDTLLWYGSESAGMWQTLNRLTGQAEISIGAEPSFRVPFDVQVPGGWVADCSGPKLLAVGRDRIPLECANVDGSYMAGWTHNIIRDLVLEAYMTVLNSPASKEAFRRQLCRQLVSKGNQPKRLVRAFVAFRVNRLLRDPEVSRKFKDLLAKLDFEASVLNGYFRLFLPSVLLASDRLQLLLAGGPTVRLPDSESVPMMFSCANYNLCRDEASRVTLEHVSPLWWAPKDFQWRAAKANDFKELAGKYIEAFQEAMADDLIWRDADVVYHPRLLAAVSDMRAVQEGIRVYIKRENEKSLFKISPNLIP
jgi:uncharacterized protein DUF5675